MDLDRLTLSPYQVSALYKKSLVITGEAAALKRAAPEPLKYLGENKRHILLLVKDPGAVYLEEKAFNFLLSILNACGLSMEAVALVNMAGTGDRTPASIVEELNSRFVLLFGIDPVGSGLPETLPVYQVEAIGNRTYLCADELSSIERERTQKGRLWACLKQLFQI